MQPALTMSTVLYVRMQSLQSCMHMHLLSLQPLRILAPIQTSGRGIEALAQGYLQMTGLQVIFDFVDIANLVTEVLFSHDTAPKTYDGW